MLISRSTANDFLSNSNSEIESITSKYYEVIANSSKYTGYTANITIADVFDRISDSFGEASAVLGAVTSSEKSITTPSIDTDTIAGETTSTSSSNSKPSSNIDVVGLAVFKGDVLVRRTHSYRSALSLNSYK